MKGTFNHKNPRECDNVHSRLLGSHMTCVALGPVGEGHLWSAADEDDWGERVSD